MLSAMLAPLVLLSSTSCVRVARSFQHLQASAPFAVARRARSSSATGAGGAHRSAATSSDAVVTELTPEELGELDFVPQSFAQCINDAATATARAIADGKMLLEVEFPPLATDVLELPECSAYDVSKANVRLSVDFAAKFAQRGTRVAIMLPDTAEKNRGEDIWRRWCVQASPAYSPGRLVVHVLSFDSPVSHATTFSLLAIEQQGTGTPFPNVTINSLTASVKDSAATSFDALFSGIFGKSGGKVKEGTPCPSPPLTCFFVRVTFSFTQSIFHSTNSM